MWNLEMNSLQRKKLAQFYMYDSYSKNGPPDAVLNLANVTLAWNLHKVHRAILLQRQVETASVEKVRQSEFT